MIATLGNWRWTLCLGAILLLPVSERPAYTGEPITLAGPSMGTTYRICVAELPASISAAALHKKIEHELEEFDRVFSTYRPDAELAGVNAAASDQWQPISPTLHALLNLARQLHEETEGRFDIAVAPLLDLWGFTGQARTSLPSTAEISAALALTGNGSWELRDAPPALRKRSAQVRFTVNAIAPGYAVDSLTQMLVDRGLQHFLVELGGEVRARGTNTQGEPWRVGLERPMASHRGEKVLSALAVKNAAVSTSGDYRNFIEIAGRKFAHVIDPRTGWPLEHRGASVVVVASDCATADAWATALFVAGPETGLELANASGLAACYMILQPKSGEVKVERSREFAIAFPDISNTPPVADRGLWPWAAVPVAAILVVSLGAWMCAKYGRRKNRL